MNSKLIEDEREINKKKTKRRKVNKRRKEKE